MLVCMVGCACMCVCTACKKIIFGVLLFCRQSQVVVMVVARYS